MAAEAVIGGLVALNSAVPVVAILRRRTLRESLMYQLLGSAAAAETIVGVVSAVMGTLKLANMLPPGWLCAVIIFCRSALVTSTVVSFLMLSLERYVTVFHGLRYFDIVTDARSRLMLAASWLVAGLIWVSGLALRCSLGVAGINMCDHWECIPPGYRITSSIIVIVVYLISLCINLVVGLAGLRQTRRITRDVASVHGNRARKLFRMHGYRAIVVLSIMFFVLILPNSVVNLMQSLGVGGIAAIHRATTHMRLISMMTDGWALAFFCPQVKEEYIRIFRMGKRPVSEKPRRCRVHVIHIE